MLNLTNNVDEYSNNESRSPAGHVTEVAEHGWRDTLGCKSVSRNTFDTVEPENDGGHFRSSPTPAAKTDLKNHVRRQGEIDQAHRDVQFIGDRVESRKIDVLEELLDTVIRSCDRAMRCFIQLSSAR